MMIGMLRVEIRLSDSRSLKDKRRVLKALKDRMKNRFNVSVAEIDCLNKWQKTVLGIAAISNSRKHLSGCLDNIMNFIADENRIMVLDYTTEIL